MKIIVFITIITGSLSLTSLSAQTITGKAAFADYSQQKPGVSRKITAADMPEPNPSEAVDNGARVIARPDGVLPIAPAGFKVTMYAGGDGGRPQFRMATSQSDSGMDRRKAHSNSPV